MNEVGILDISGFFPSLRLTETFALPTYFLTISIALIICLFWLVRRSDNRGIPRARALDVALVLMISGFMGARIFHVVLEEPRYYLEAPLRFFEVWRGGFVWYGGALIGAASAIGFLSLQNLAVPLWLDLFAPVTALGYAMGRLACLFTGCCFGSMTQFFGHIARHPTQLYACIWELSSLAILLHLEKRRQNLPIPLWLTPPGQVFLSWLSLHSSGRIIMEFFRADPRGPAPLGLSLSTWISLALLVLALALLVKRRPFIESRAPV
jgi:phosphatidylglycerol:prolipoprotein diacylglycerol transferase